MTRMLWRGAWIDVPAPHPVEASVLLAVEATVPLLPLGAVHGRDFGSPARKVASFVLTDGPLAAARKVRAKRAESGMTGDFHLVLAVGTSPAGERLVALVPRAPRCAQLLLAAPALTLPAPAELDPRGVAAALLDRADELAPLVRQNYLYSGMEPPPELTDALAAALASPRPGGVAVELLTPPPLGGEPAETLTISPRAATSARPPLAQLGAGDYVRIEVAPALADAEVERVVIADRQPQIAALAAAELGFAAATSNAEAAIDQLDRRGVVLVATAHDSHAALAARALDAGHRVLLEKPAVVAPSDLDLLEAAATRNPGELEVGFNRRHHPLVERAHELVAAEEGPATILASIREVDITPDHWYLWPNQGTRVAGNLCHWIDLAFDLLGPERAAVEVAVSPRVSADPGDADAERAFTITFDDGSMVCLVPTTRGDSIRGVQEQIEIRRGRLAIRLDDLWHLTGVRRGVPVRRRTVWRGKAHERMYRRGLERFAAGQPAAYPLADVRRVAEVQLAATEAVRSGAPAGPVAELLEAARERERRDG